MPQGVGKNMNQAFLVECVVDCINYTQNLVRRVQDVQIDGMEKVDDNKLIARRTVLRLGFEAFARVFAFHFNRVQDEIHTAMSALGSKIMNAMHATIQADKESDAGESVGGVRGAKRRAEKA